MNNKIAAEIQAEQNHGREKYGRGPDDFAHDDSHLEEDWHFLFTRITNAQSDLPQWSVGSI